MLLLLARHSTRRKVVSTGAQVRANDPGSKRLCQDCPRTGQQVQEEQQMDVDSKFHERNAAYRNPFSPFYFVFCPQRRVNRFLDVVTFTFTSSSYVNLLLSPRFFAHLITCTSCPSIEMKSNAFSEQQFLGFLRLERQPTRRDQMDGRPLATDRHQSCRFLNIDKP